GPHAGHRHDRRRDDVVLLCAHPDPAADRVDEARNEALVRRELTASAGPGWRAFPLPLPISETFGIGNGSGSGQAWPALACPVTSQTSATPRNSLRILAPGCRKVCEDLCAASWSSMTKRTSALWSARS